MLALVVKFIIKPGFVDAFERAILDNARASRETEAGCRQFDVCRDPNDAHVFFLYELYDDQAAIDLHLQSRHYAQMNTETTEWVAEKLVWRYARQAP
jgi:quinol monooxygenase YgiN